MVPDDSRIIQLFFSRDEKAIAQTDLYYGAYCRTIARNILKNDSDAEECVSDTYLKLWDNIPPARPDPLKAYIGTICRRISLNRYERKRSKKRADEAALALSELEECIPNSDSGDDIGESIALREALKGFISSLDGREKRIFLMRYWYICPIKTIAAETSSGESAIKMSLLRTREKLKNYLEKEGFSV